MSTLRFAILCRVSTEIQEEKGVSLEVQKNTLSNCVGMLKGQIVKEYIGQEHGTEGHDRPILDQMLTDARNKVFDALMVYDLSRLTRDPLKSKIILAELRKHSILLYVQATHHPLDNPETNLMVGLMSEINAYHAAIQVQKSIESRIELAKKGFPVFGRTPWGRKIESLDYSKDAVWLVDPEAIKKANEVYDLYINQGIYVDKLPAIVGISRHKIYTVLKDKPIHRQSVMYKGQKLEFENQIPTLLTKEQLAITKQRLKKNKRNNGKKFDYLLSSLVKCERCKLTFIGVYPHLDTPRGGYYRHSHYSPKTEECAKHIPLLKLDQAVLDNIIEVVGNNELLMKCIKESNELSSERKMKLEEQHKTITANLNGYERKKERVIKLMIDEVIDDEDVKKQLPDLKAKIEECKKTLVAIETEIESLSSLDVPEEVLAKITYIIGCFKEHFGHEIKDWPFTAQRALIEWFFGTDKDNGVYVGRSGKSFQYTIKSNLGTMAFGEFTSSGFSDDGHSYGIVGLAKSRMKLENLAAFRSIFQHDLYTRNTVGKFKVTV